MKETRQAAKPGNKMFGFKRGKAPAFEDVLDRISEQESDIRVDAEDVEPQAPHVNPAASNQPNDWLLQMLSGMIPEEAEPPADNTAHRREYEYAANLEDAIAPLLEAIVECEEDAIAEELGLHEHLSADELQKRRRLFARKNHPDRFHPEQRDLATHRMTIANMLIDRELQQRAR